MIKHFINLAMERLTNVFSGSLKETILKVLTTLAIDNCSGSVHPPCMQILCPRSPNRECYNSLSPLCRSIKNIETSMSGIHESCEEAISINFNVIIPKQLWEWNKKCQIFLRFGNLRLGLWGMNVGKFETFRYVQY